MVAEEPQAAFLELVEDCVDLILTDYLDLPTLLSYGYTSKSAIAQEKKIVGRKQHHMEQMERVLSDVAQLG